MRWVVLLAIVAAAAFALGWWYVRDTSESTEIIIDKEEVMSDTKEAVEEGRELIDDAREGMEQLSVGDESDAPEDRHPEGASAGTSTESPEKEPAAVRE